VHLAFAVCMLGKLSPACQGDCRYFGVVRYSVSPGHDAESSNGSAVREFANSPIL